MKKCVAVVFVLLLFVSVFFSKNITEKKIRLNIYNAFVVVEGEENGIKIGDYTLKKLQSNYIDFSKNKYISFNTSENMLSTLFDFFKCDIVKKYTLSDNIIYDCHSDIISINKKINIQIVVGEEVKVGIPTIFEGF